MRKIFPALLMAAFLVLGGARAFAQAPRTEAPAYKMNESWTYRAADKLYEGYRSDLLNGDYELAFQRGQLEVRRVNGAAKVQAYSPGVLNLMVPAKPAIASPEPPFEFPLWVGQKWDAEYMLERGDITDRRRMLTAHNTVTGLETVQTSAGNFRAFKIERRARFVGGVANRVEWDLIDDFFYSPDTRSVVKLDSRIEKVFNFGDKILERSTNIELIDWSPR